MRLGVAGGRLFRVMKFKAFSALLLFSFLCCGPLRAEVIRGPAELRSGDTGKAAASLYDGAKVECVRSTAPWIETGFLAYVDNHLEAPSRRLCKIALSRSSLHKP